MMKRSLLVYFCEIFLFFPRERVEGIWLVEQEDKIHRFDSFKGRN